MSTTRMCALLLVLSGVVAPAGIVGQVPVVISGRIEDAATRQPILGVSVLSGDSSVATMTDSVGNFDLQLPTSGPWVVHAERFGYVSQRFDVGGPPEPRRYVLLLEPAPIEIEALSVEAEAAVARLVRNLESRRRSSAFGTRVLDRTWIDRFGPVGASVLDLVLQASPQLFECVRSPRSLCVNGRGYPEQRILVCINERESFDPVSELWGMPTDGIARVELYRRSQVRIYTRLWMLNRARAGITGLMSINLPIPGC